MTRTYGAKDRIPRKSRSDKGKKRKRYAGKPVRKTKRRIFPKKIGNKQYIKLFLIRRQPMTKDGYKRINKRIRAFMKKEIMSGERIRIDAHTNQIDTKEKMEQFVADQTWSGLWDVRMFCHAKNRFKVSPKTSCLVSVKETEKGNIGRMIENRRLHRYKWFYKS